MRDVGIEEIRQAYHDSLGKRRYTIRSRSDLGKLEMAALGKAQEMGHMASVHVDNTRSSFLACTECDMMGSVTIDEGISGSILEVECGTKISFSDPERAWDQAEDPYKYQVEARVFDEELPDQ